MHILEETNYRIDDLPNGVRLVLLIGDREVGYRDTDMDEAVALGTVWLIADEEGRPLEEIANELTC